MSRLDACPRGEKIFKENGEVLLLQIYEGIVGSCSSHSNFVNMEF